jgi:hypothetical protein
MEKRWFKCIAFQYECSEKKYVDLGDCVIFTLNVLVEWLTLLLNIREIPGSNLGPETGYPD